MLAVKINKKALKELELLPEDIKTKIIAVCKSLADDPFDGDIKPLKGIPGVFR